MRVGMRVYLKTEQDRFKGWYMVLAETLGGSVILGHLDHGLVQGTHVYLLRRQDFGLIQEIRKGKVHADPVLAG